MNYTGDGWARYIWCYRVNFLQFLLQAYYVIKTWMMTEDSIAWNRGRHNPSWWSEGLKEEDNIKTQEKMFLKKRRHWHVTDCSPPQRPIILFCLRLLSVLYYIRISVIRTPRDQGAFVTLKLTSSTCTCLRSKINNYVWTEASCSVAIVNVINF